MNIHSKDEIPYDIQERTFQFAVRIVLFYRNLPSVSEATRILARQLLKSGTSIGANMEEADGGQTKADFIAKVAIARKEAKETVYWLRVLAATDALLKNTIPPLLDEANQIASIVTAIKRNAEANQKRGDSPPTDVPSSGSQSYASPDS